MLNFMKTSILGAILGKIVNFGLDPHIFDAKTHTFIPVGANLFVYLKHICIQNIEKNNW